MKDTSSGMRALSAVLILFGVLCALGGFVSLTQATLGVGSICLALFFLVLARIAQAGGHHQQTIAARDDEKPPPVP